MLGLSTAKEAMAKKEVKSMEENVQVILKYLHAYPCAHTV